MQHFFPKILTQYDCGLQPFPFNTLMSASAVILAQSAKSREVQNDQQAPKVKCKFVAVELTNREPREDGAGSAAPPLQLLGFL